MEVACPQCGNPNLDVDEANSVVFCKNCGFAVKVDPQSGNVTPLSEGGAGGGAMEAPQSYGKKSIFGTDPLTFFLGATAVLLLSLYISFIPMSYFMLLESAVILIWWYGR
ncbi:hypothetical protein HY989_03000 [Candidatus Micrarchaeota archaeon]|nr:hypothetical protein [Candidatus Micrarchaeota archaeon]